jgi:hypothetical protein
VVVVVDGAGAVVVVVAACGFAVGDGRYTTSLTNPGEVLLTGFAGAALFETFALGCFVPFASCADLAFPSALKLPFEWAGDDPRGERYSDDTTAARDSAPMMVP